MAIRTEPRGAQTPPIETRPAASKPATDTSIKGTVDQEATFDGKLEAHVLHDVLVRAGANLDSAELAVRLGQPKLIASNLVPGADGRSIEREDEIEVTVVIKTKQKLSLFVDALGGATVDAATLTLTPRGDQPAKVNVTKSEGTPAQ